VYPYPGTRGSPTKHLADHHQTDISELIIIDHTQLLNLDSKTTTTTTTNKPKMAAVGLVLASRCVKLNVGYRYLSRVPHGGLLHVSFHETCGRYTVRRSVRLTRRLRTDPSGQWVTNF